MNKVTTEKEKIIKKSEVKDILTWQDGILSHLKAAEGLCFYLMFYLL